MSKFDFFIIGMACGVMVSVALAYWYYLHARRRVAKIKEAIAQSQKASEVVGEACDKICSCK